MSGENAENKGWEVAICYFPSFFTFFNKKKVDKNRKV